MLEINKIKKGSQLRKFRKSFGLSQEKFARAIKMSMNRINFLEVHDWVVTDNVREKIRNNFKILKEYN